MRKKSFLNNSKCLKNKAPEVFFFQNLFYAGTVVDDMFLQEPEGSILDKIYKEMLLNKRDQTILSYDEGKKKLLSKDGMQAVYIGSRDTFFGTEGLVALDLINPAKFPTAPALPMGSEFR